MQGRRSKLVGILAGVSMIVFAATCPWFHNIIGVDDNAACACDSCVEACEHVNADVCDCDGDCGCPNCVVN